MSLFSIILITKSKIKNKYGLKDKNGFIYVYVTQLFHLQLF